MKNIYSILSLDANASILDICRSYQKKCMLNPNNIFYYTQILEILGSYSKRLIYDAMLFQVDIFLLANCYHYELQEEEEYELAHIISWIEDFREYVYDLKFLVTDAQYLILMESWYDQMENILFELKCAIKSFYLT